jgi:hypothetical protein
MRRSRARSGNFEPWLDHAPGIGGEGQPRRRAPRSRREGARKQQAHQATEAKPQNDQPWWSRD